MAEMSVFLLFPSVDKFQIYLTDEKMKGEMRVCEVVR